MLSAVLKRPLEPDSAENIVHVQPASDSDDDLSSPEKLLSLQPVVDDYSSDDCLGKARKKPVRSCKGENSPQKNGEVQPPVEAQAYQLSYTMKSSDMSAEMMVFYLNVDYKAALEGVSLEDKSLEECLFHLLLFSPCSTSAEFGREHFKWKGRSMAGVKEDLLVNQPSFTWLFKNDNLHLKKSSPQEILQLEQLCLKLKTGKWYEDRREKPAKNVRSAIIELQRVYTELLAKPLLRTVADVRVRHDIVKMYTEALAGLVEPAGYLRNGLCEDDFTLYMQPDVVPDGSVLLGPGTGRTVGVRTRPDGVYTVTRALEEGNLKSSYDTWALAVQVFVPRDEMTTVERRKLSDEYPIPSFSPDDNMESVKEEPNTKNYSRKEPSDRINSKSRVAMAAESSQTVKDTISTPMKPELSPNIILSPQFVADARSYVINSVPPQCRGCVDTIAAQHVMQLFCAAKQNQPQIFDKIYIDGVVRVLGMFVVNEFVYFSQLEIEKEALPIIEGQLYERRDKRGEIAALVTAKLRSYKPPLVSFSAWRLDLTVANHRLALVVFLNEYFKFCQDM